MMMTDQLAVYRVLVPDLAAGTLRAGLAAVAGDVLVEVLEVDSQVFHCSVIVSAQVLPLHRRLNRLWPVKEVNQRIFEYVTMTILTKDASISYVPTVN